MLIYIYLCGLSDPLKTAKACECVEHMVPETINKSVYLTTEWFLVPLIMYLSCICIITVDCVYIYTQVHMYMYT